MKKLYFLLFTLFAFSFTYGQELLLNGDFESWDDPTSPTSWTKAESTDQESVEFHGGTYSAKHTGGTSDISQTVTGIIPGNSYTITIWYKVDAGFGDGTDARIWSYWRNTGSNITDTPTADDLRGPAGGYFDANGNIWTEYTVTVIAPATANEFYFEVRTYSSAIVYWDDFSFFAEAASSDPALVITAPNEGSTELTANTDIAFIVSNFDVATAGLGDGHIHYTVDGGGTVMKYDTTTIQLTGLSDGPHTVYMELVDDSHTPIAPAVNATVNFTTNNIVQTFPFIESFDYTVSEDLGAQNIWTDNFSGASPVISTGSLSYSTLSGNGNSVSFSGIGADPTVDYTPTSSGKIYASFMLKVTAFDAAAVDGYFAILRNDGGSYESRVWISPITATTYQVGISNSSTLTQIDPTTYNLNDEIFIVFNYDIDGDTVSAWINPTLGGVEPSADISEASGSTGNTFSQLMIRRDSATETPSIVMDELRIGTSWADVTPITLGTNDFETNNFKIYPNPTSLGFVNIASRNSETIKATVFDILGKQVINSTVTNNKLDVSNLNVGIYIMRLTQNNATVTKKLVIK
ncbi:MAG: T9SS type A sorting domain-containing protein [Bacteroidetes bacterium]|nr:T9SS type A sorting domain-containing protein [Bacteroidota bacterium]